MRLSAAGIGPVYVSRRSQSLSARNWGSMMIPISFDWSDPFPTGYQVPLRGSNQSARYEVSLNSVIAVAESATLMIRNN
jgi:hypothetical protein